MGQYYQCLTKKGGDFTHYSLQVKGWKHHGEAKDYEPTYNGVKLLEHSWWGNDFMKAITSKLYKNAMQVAWVGDYANDYNWEHPENKPDPKALCWLAWGGMTDAPILDEEDIDAGNMTLDGKYLVNHTKCIYINGDEYKKLNEDKDGWCIHPLSLLTACGNGLGGGDYHDNNPDYWRVGEWCFDEISVEDEAPENYTKEIYNFKEI